jgi:hypothetical protein
MRTVSDISHVSSSFQPDLQPRVSRGPDRPTKSSGQTHADARGETGRTILPTRVQKGHVQGTAATSTCTVLYDPEGVIESGIPLDRAPFEALATAVLTSADSGLPAGDCQQIALALTGHARAVVTDLHHRARLLPADDARRTPAEAVLEAAERHLSAPLQGTAHCVRSRAKLVRALYEQLDRLKGTSPGSVTPDPAPDSAPHPAPEAGSDTGPEARAGQPAD